MHRKAKHMQCLLQDGLVLHRTMDLIGTGSYVFIALVCKNWKNAYTSKGNSTCAASVGGSLSRVMFALKHGAPMNKTAYLCAIGAAGNITAIEFCEKKFGLGYQHRQLLVICEAVFDSRRFDFVSQVLHLHPEHANVLSLFMSCKVEKALKRDDYEAVQWLFESEVSPAIKELCRCKFRLYACSQPGTDSFKKLTIAGGVSLCDTWTLLAAKYRNLELMRVLIDEAFPFHEHTYTWAAILGDEAMMDFLRHHKCYNNDHLLAEFVLKHQREIREWFDKIYHLGIP